MIVRQYQLEVNLAINRLDIAPIIKSVDILKKAHSEGRYVYTFGNGGSAATASHFAGDLAKGCGYKAFCLNDPIPAFTAWANDTEYAAIYENQVMRIVEGGDVVVGLSGSGNSPNILNGIKAAKLKGATTIGLTAFDGGKLKNLVDIPIVVPTRSLEQAEDVHLIIWHMIKTKLLEKKK